MAAPRGVMNIKVTGSPALSVGEPPSVPSRISVVLVEEAKSGDTPRLECPREDNDIRLLAGEAKPASVTVCEDDLVDSPALSVGGPPSVPSRISVVRVEEAKAEGTPCLGCPREDQDMWLLAGVVKPVSGTVCIDSLGSPCVGETLSSSDIIGRLLPVVPAGISFSVGPVDPAGPNGPYVAGGPVGPYGTLSPSDSNPAGPAGPYVAGGPVGPDGTLSPFFSDPAGPVGFAGDPVGPDGTLSPFKSDPAGPDGPYG